MSEFNLLLTKIKNIKKVFLALAVVATMAWGSDVKAQIPNPDICQLATIYCGDGTGGTALLCGQFGERLSQVAVWYELICN